MKNDRAWGKLWLPWLLLLWIAAGIDAGDGEDEEDFDISMGQDARVAANAEGASLVVWSADDDVEGGIFAQAYGSAGEPVGPVFLVNTTVTEEQDQPDVAALSTGDFVVLWRSTQGIRDVILARRVRSDGVPLATELRINAEPPLAAAPAVGADASGNFVVVWEGEGDLFARRFDSGGSPLGMEQRFALGESAEAPAVGVAAAGDFLVAWESSDDILGQRFDAAGLPTGDEFVINETLKSDQTEPTIAATPEGFLVAWRSEGQDEEGAAILARYVDDLPEDEEMRINTGTAGDQIQPAASSDAVGNVLVTWQSEGGQDGSSSGIFGRFLRPPRRPVCPDFLINTRTLEAQRNPALDGFVEEFFVVWQTEPDMPPPMTVPLIQGRRVASPIFMDDFESGDLSYWSAVVSP